MEVTDEMVAAFNEADFSGCGNADWSDEHVRAGLAAALVVAERGIKPPPGPCSVSGPSFHTAQPILCDLRHGHEGDHENSNGARWRYLS